MVAKNVRDLNKMIQIEWHCEECGTLAELDQCLCCGKELCRDCLLKHGRIATELKKRRVEEGKKWGPHPWFPPVKILEDDDYE